MTRTKKTARPADLLKQIDQLLTEASRADTFGDRGMQAHALREAVREAEQLVDAIKVMYFRAEGANATKEG